MSFFRTTYQNHSHHRRNHAMDSKGTASAYFPETQHQWATGQGRNMEENMKMERGVPTPSNYGVRRSIVSSHNRAQPRTKTVLVKFNLHRLPLLTAISSPVSSKAGYCCSPSKKVGVLVNYGYGQQPHHT